jgi:phage gp45-like
MSEDLNRRLASLFARGVIRHADVRNGLAQAQAEFSRGELRRVGLPQGYGMASQPTPGAEVFAVFANGERDAGMALAHDDRRARPTDLAAGETMVYGARAFEAPWHWIKFTDDPKPGTVKIKAKRVEIRCGDYYSVIDADTGPHSGMWPMMDPVLPV